MRSLEGSLRIKLYLLNLITIIIPFILGLYLIFFRKMGVAVPNKTNLIKDAFILLLLGILAAITYQYRLSLRKQREEERFAQMERLAMIGQLAAGMAHEIRNPLTSVKGFVQLMQNREECQPFNEYFEVIKNELKQIEEIINETLLLAQPKEGVKEELNVVVLAGKVVDELQEFARASGIELILEMEKESLVVLGEREQLKTALVNFIRNGIEAIPQGGEVNIQIRQDANNIIITIRDTGTGMTPEVMARVGTPFYTTKDNGTGLGMLVAYQMIYNHGGRVELESKPGEGTRVTIMLPLNLPG